MKLIGVRKKELKVTDPEVMMLWMLRTVKKRKRVEPFKQQILREVIKKEEGRDMAEKFEDKYKGFKIELLLSPRPRTIQYITQGAKK